MKLDSITRLYTNDKEVRIYRPILKKLAKTRNGALFLSQAIYWSTKNNHGWFYKFNGECGHDLYRKGDSWEEELGFSKKEFTTVKSNLVFTGGAGTEKKYKNKFGDNWEEELKKDIENSYIISYQTSNRLTFYQVNIKKINDDLEKLYKEQDKADNERLCQQKQVKPFWEFSFNKNIETGVEQNKGFETVETSEHQQNQLSVKKEFSKTPKGNLDISKTTTKNNKDPKGFSTSSVEEKTNVEAMTKVLNDELTNTSKLITVSKAITKSKYFNRMSFTVSVLVPLAKKLGIQSVINILRDIYSEARTEPIQDLEGLIKSRIRKVA